MAKLRKSINSWKCICVALPLKSGTNGVQWFPLAESWKNTMYHEVTEMNPYQVVYGKQPPSITSYLLVTFKVQEVESLPQNFEWPVEDLNDNLAIAQNRMK